MPDQAAAQVSLAVSAQRQALERPVSVPEEPLVLAQEEEEQPQPPAQPAARALVDPRPELRCAQLLHRADRFARARSVSQLFLVLVARV